jgi:hypothetical protein
LDAALNLKPKGCVKSPKAHYARRLSGDHSMPPLILKVLATLIPTHGADNAKLETDHPGLQALLANIEARQEQEPETRKPVGDKLAVYARVTGPYHKLYLDVYQKAYNREYDRMTVPRRDVPRIDPGRGDGKLPRIDPGRGDGKFRR